MGLAERGLKRYLENLTAFHNPDGKIKIRLFSGRSELGFTDNTTICLNRYPESLDKRLVPSAVIVLGVFAHELLHTLFTAFDYSNEIFSKCERQKSEKFARVFQYISNLLEDSAIENFAPTVFGGPMLKALRFVIKTIFDISPPITEAVNPWEQFVNAFIDVGDLGYYKGEFTFEEAKEMYEKVLPLFYKGTMEKNAKRRIDIAREITEITEPLWNPYFAEVPDDSIGKGSGEGKDFDGEGSSPMDKKGTSKSFKKGKGDSEKRKRKSVASASDDSGDSGDSDGKPDGSPDMGDEKDKSSSKKHGDKSDEVSDETSDESKNKSEHKSEDKSDDDDETDDGDDGDETDDDSEADDDGDDDEDEELDAKTLEELKKGIEREVAKEEAEAAREEEYTEKAQPTGFGRSICIRPSDGNIEFFNQIKSQNAVAINALRRGLDDIFAKDVDSIETSTSGSFNVAKYAKSKTSTPTAKIFDKRRVTDGKSDVSILLLVDESGSMAGGNERDAREAAILLSSALVSLHIPFSVVGFTADEVRYEPDHRIYVDFGDKQLQGLTELRARNQNRDGDSIRFAASKLKERSETNKILFVISDGVPWAGGYSGLTAIEDTQNAVKEARKEGLTVFSIGVGYASAWGTIYGAGNYITIKKSSQLPALLLKRIKEI